MILIPSYPHNLISCEGMKLISSYFHTLSLYDNLTTWIINPSTASVLQFPKSTAYSLQLGKSTIENYSLHSTIEKLSIPLKYFFKKISKNDLYGKRSPYITSIFDHDKNNKALKYLFRENIDYKENEN